MQKIVNKKQSEPYVSSKTLTEAKLWFYGVVHQMWLKPYTIPVADKEGA